MDSDSVEMYLNLNSRNTFGIKLHFTSHKKITWETVFGTFNILFKKHTFFICSQVMQLLLLTTESFR